MGFLLHIALQSGLSSHAESHVPKLKFLNPPYRIEKLCFGMSIVASLVSRQQKVACSMGTTEPERAPHSNHSVMPQESLLVVAPTCGEDRRSLPSSEVDGTRARRDYLIVCRSDSFELLFSSISGFLSHRYGMPVSERGRGVPLKLDPHPLLDGRSLHTDD